VELLGKYVRSKELCMNMEKVAWKGDPLDISKSLGAEPVFRVILGKSRYLLYTPSRTGQPNQHV
jgi:hypothetical protein